MSNCGKEDRRHKSTLLIRILTSSFPTAVEPTSLSITTWIGKLVVVFNHRIRVKAPPVHLDVRLRSSSPPGLPSSRRPLHPCTNRIDNNGDSLFFHTVWGISEAFKRFVILNFRAKFPSPIL